MSYFSKELNESPPSVKIKKGKNVYCMSYFRECDFPFSLAEACVSRRELLSSGLSLLLLPFSISAVRSCWVVIRPYIM